MRTRSLDFLGFPKYEISENGVIVSLKTGKVKKPVIHHAGYFKVGLSHNYLNKRFFVHRLIALSFIENKNNYPCVNHKDGDKKNNSIENLEWCTKSQNTQHSWDTGLREKKLSINHNNAKLTDTEILTIITCSSVGIERWILAKAFKVSRKTIGNISTNKKHQMFPRIGYEFTGESSREI